MSFLVLFAFCLLGSACSPTTVAVEDPAAQKPVVDRPAVEKPAETPASGVASGSGTRTVRMEPAVIVDATGFEKPLAAATLFLPHGWSAEGGVFWGAEFTCTNGYAFRWNARSPDGATQISILPQEKWEWNNYGAGVSTPGCALQPWTNVKSYLEALVHRVKPGARIKHFQPREDLRKQFAQYETSTPMPMGEARTWVEAAEIRATFTEAGQEKVGTILVVAVFSLLRNNSGMGVMDAITGSTFPAYATSAPAKAHDAALYEAIRTSIQVDPNWERRIQGHNVAIGRVALEEGRKRAAIIAKSSAEIAAIRSAAWESYSISADRRAKDFADALRGVQTWRDTAAPGGTVALSHNYDHAWRLNDGSYVLSNDPSFDPWRDLKVEGKKLGLER
ncbi:MAG: hypothetical protein JNL28_17650 [Planctomycetes bacterium]|nr:hypothetical protein [Planctomycetota bacterium]